MKTTPQEISLDLKPTRRFDIIDISEKINELINGDKDRYQKATYCSYHTTAGYLEQSICSRMDHHKNQIRSYIRAFQQLFPDNAAYQHDRLDLRPELSDAQRLTESRNADSHLTFIGCGLKNCVTYLNKPRLPVYFIELDGISEHGRRTRHTSAMYYNNEELVYKRKVRIPVSTHPIDSVNLRDPKLGYLEKLSELLTSFEVEWGRVEISLDPRERNAALTVNEYETLLMTHDLYEVLKNPLRFMGEKGKYLLQNPGKIPSRTREYAKYDFVRIFNELMDAFHISQSVLEKIFARVLAVPAERYLRMRRNISFLVSNTGADHSSGIVQGRYQSPILVQWQKPVLHERQIILSITRYK